MTLTQFEYYQKQRIHPDELAVEDPTVFDRYQSIRKNLYEHLLHLPLSLLGGKDVLEVGCGTGESALMLALHGARLSLVDADPTVGPRLNGLFEGFGVADRIRRKTFCSLDKYEDEPIFSLVTAEGFLFTLPNRDAMLSKLCRLIQPGGFGVVSFPDRFGSFTEFLKKAVMWRACQIEGIRDIYSESSLRIARELFGETHRRLPHSREFAIWWKDSLVSPFLTWDHCWAYDEILELLAGEGCEFYSSSPRLYELPHLTWYKDVRSPEEHRAAVLRNYGARKFDFLFGEPVGVSPETPGLGELSEAVAKVLRALSAYFRTPSEPVPSIDFQPIARLFAEVGIQHELVPEFVDFFHLLRTQSLTKLVKGYAALQRLSLSWGCSYHYLCFAKDRELMERAVFK